MCERGGNTGDAKGYWCEGAVLPIARLQWTAFYIRAASSAPHGLAVTSPLLLSQTCAG